MTPQQQKQIANLVTAAAPGIGALVSAFATPVAGAAVSGVLLAAAKLWLLGLDPQAELEAIRGYEDTLAKARAKIAADVDAKFGEVVEAEIRLEPPAQLDDIYDEGPK